MKKEMMISILVGLIFGLIITYGVYRARTSLTRVPDSESLLTSPTPTPSTNAAGLLTITSPEDESVQSTTDVTVAGKAPADSHIVVFINDDEHLTTSDGSGHFSVTAELEDGSNVIGVYTIDEEGQVASEERVVIVSATDTSNENAAIESAEKSQ